MEVLVNHTNMIVKRNTRRRYSDRTTIEADLPFIRLIQTIQDPHQRRLAGAVFPKKAMNLSPAHRKVDAVIGNNPRKALDDAMQLNGVVGYSIQVYSL